MLAKAEATKKIGDAKVKDKNHDDALKQYLKALDIIRGNDTLKADDAGVDLEVAIRSNISLCKRHFKNWAEVIDQSERILEKANERTAIKLKRRNIIIKSAFRWAEALYERSDGDPDVMGKDDVKLMFKYLMMADQIADGKNLEVKEMLEKVKDFE